MPWPQPRSCLNLAQIQWAMKPWQGFCCFAAPTRSCSDWFCPHLALPRLTSPRLTLPCLAPPCLAAYPILKSLIMPHHVKMCLVLWQLTIWYSYLVHFNQFSFSFPVLFCLVQSLSCPVLFHHHLFWFYSFAGAQPSRGGATVMMSNHMFKNLVKAFI